MSDVLLLSSLFNVVKVAEPLGVCYLAAVARKAGFSVDILDPAIEGWSPKRAAVEIGSRRSAILGISVLRDEQKADVCELLGHLRAAGDRRFVVVGGHAPTIAITTGEEDNPPPMEGWDIPVAIQEGKWGPGEDWASSAIHNRRTPTYTDVARLCDAFMLGESDLSFPMLVDAVLSGADWRTVPGVAYLGRNGSFVVGRPATKPSDLDALPPMARDILAEYNQAFPGKVAASINLGRGCFYQCTFCTVAVFQQLQEGSRHRQRSVESVVDEIREVHVRYGVSDFNFEDDNFIIKNKRGVEKIHALCDALQALPFKIRFTIFCRADVVEADLFAHLRDAGMTIVYLGLESVYEPDLEFFHKGLKLRVIWNALDTLMSVGYGLEVNDGLRVKLGFIAWHPLTSYESLRASIDFVSQYNLPPKLLRRKLLLYSGIPIKHQIRELGLLDPDSVAGWKYQYPELRHLENAVETFVQLIVSKPYRDRVRTIEKALVNYSHEPVPPIYVRLQQEMDDQCIRFVRGLVDHVQGLPQRLVAGEVASFLGEWQSSFRRYIRENEVSDLIEAGFAEARIPLTAGDLFRQ